MSTGRRQARSYSCLFTTASKGLWAWFQVGFIALGLLLHEFVRKICIQAAYLIKATTILEEWSNSCRTPAIKSSCEVDTCCPLCLKQTLTLLQVLSDFSCSRWMKRSLLPVPVCLLIFIMSATYGKLQPLWQAPIEKWTVWVAIAEQCRALLPALHLFLWLSGNPVNKMAQLTPGSYRQH